MVNRIAAALSLTALLLAGPLEAQQPDSGTVTVTVQEPMGAVADAVIRDGNRSATTDAKGRTTITLPAGRRTLVVTRTGYVTRRVNVTVMANDTVTLTIDVDMEEPMLMEMEELVVTATRIPRLAGNTPIRVEVVDEMEVDENTLMAPSGITMLLNETPGLRVQSASPTLGTGSVRILGLPGQYTAMLADGLPIYGGAASALGPLDISPVDLSRVEVIKGVASALYGGQSLGGVINLISKQPTGRNEVLVNRRTLEVTDVASWFSRRFSDHSGLSLLASGTIQGAVDRDGDGWGDQARARRWGVRPRFSSNSPDGRALFVTAGFGYDDRQGGTMGNATTPAGLPFREGLTGRRADVGAMVRMPRTDSGQVAVRFALSTNGRERRFGDGPTERDRVATGFAELTRTMKIKRGALVLGAAVQADAYHNELNDRFDHDWVTPGLFVTADRDLGALTLSASVRGDMHPDEGIELTERLAVLFRPAEEWTVRVGGGTGFSAATPLTEEVEAIGLRALQPSSLSGEKSFGAMLDVNGRLLGAEFLMTGYRSFIDDAIQLVEHDDLVPSVMLRNAIGTTRVGGIEAAAIWRFGANKFLLTYGYARGSRPDAQTGEREEVPLLHRHRLGGDLMLEKPGVYRAGIEAIYYGRQALDEDPYRRSSKPYVYAMAIAMRQFGPLEVVANFENLLDIRQTEYQPLVRPTPTAGGRWTTDVWAPLEGFMANVALRYRWPRAM